MKGNLLCYYINLSFVLLNIVLLVSKSWNLECTEYLYASYYKLYNNLHN